MVRHESIDRTFHWLMAASIFVLIFTGTAPILGLRIAWLNIHWISGLLLTFLIVAHIIRSCSGRISSHAAHTQGFFGAIRFDFQAG